VVGRNFVSGISKLKPKKLFKNLKSLKTQKPKKIDKNLGFYQPCSHRATTVPCRRLADSSDHTA